MTRAFFQGPKGHKERGRLSPAYQFTASQLLCQRWLHSPKNTAIDGAHTIHFCDVTTPKAKKPTLNFLSFSLNISLNLISHRSLIFAFWYFPPFGLFIEAWWIVSHLLGTFSIVCLLCALMMAVKLYWLSLVCHCRDSSNYNTFSFSPLSCVTDICIEAWPQIGLTPYYSERALMISRAFTI